LLYPALTAPPEIPFIFRVGGGGTVSQRWSLEGGGDKEQDGNKRYRKKLEKRDPENGVLFLIRKLLSWKRESRERSFITTFGSF
jgi:hypothetical protein